MFVLDELADKLLKKGKDVIKITIGITKLKVPENVLNVMSDTVHDDSKTHLVYPQGVPALREAIADYYNTQFNTDVSM
ncbi:MAG: hypothetical protein HOI47_07945, partial [Candidatus Scalindua sp.]|nr:hypothetical protein [Candidatus Scalindua sp.]